MEGMASSSFTFPSLQVPLNRYGNLSAQDWEDQRPEITRLYSTEQRELHEVIRMMGEDHGFFATESQYKKKIQKWHLGRNIKSHEMGFIVRAIKKRKAQGKRTAARVRGQPVAQRKIDKWNTRNNSMSNVPLQHPSPPAATPSDISMYTPSPPPGTTNAQPAVQNSFTPSAQAPRHESPLAGDGCQDFLTSPPSDTFSEVHLDIPNWAQVAISWPASPLAEKDDTMMQLDSSGEFPPSSPLISDGDPFPLNSGSHSAESPQSQVLTEEDLRTSFALIRQCTELGHRKAGMDIFLNLCDKLDALELKNWRPISREVRRKYKGVPEERILAHAQRAITQLEVEHGPDYVVLLDLCSIVAALYFVPEMLVPGKERKKLSPTEMLRRLDEGKPLLERVLKQGLDNDTVQKLLDATSFDECLPLGKDAADGILERLVLQGSKQPPFARAFGALLHYYNLRSRYIFTVELLMMLDQLFTELLVLEVAKSIDVLIQMGYIIIYESESEGSPGTLYVTERARWPLRPEDEELYQPPDDISESSGDTTLGDDTDEREPARQDD